MTILSLTPILNDNAPAQSGTSHNPSSDRIPRLPSEPVLRVMRIALQCLGPLAPNDAMVLSRMLNRLFEIEHDNGVGAAVSHAKELVEVLCLQQRAAR